MLDILRERSWLVEELEIPERTFPASNQLHV